MLKPVATFLRRECIFLFIEWGIGSLYLFCFLCLKMNLWVSNSTSPTTTTPWYTCVGKVICCFFFACLFGVFVLPVMCLMYVIETVSWIFYAVHLYSSRLCLPISLSSLFPIQREEEKKEDSCVRTDPESVENQHPYPYPMNE